MTIDVQITHCDDIVTGSETPLLVKPKHFHGPLQKISSLTLLMRASFQDRAENLKLCAEKFNHLLGQDPVSSLFDAEIFYSDSSIITEYQSKRMQLPAWKKISSRKQAFGIPFVEIKMQEHDGNRTVSLFYIEVDHLLHFQQEIIKFQNAFIFFYAKSNIGREQEIGEKIYRYGMFDEKGRPSSLVQWSSLVANVSEDIVICRSFYDEHHNTVGIDIFINEKQSSFLRRTLSKLHKRN